MPGPLRVTAEPPPLVVVRRVVAPVTLFVTRDVVAQSLPRRTPVCPQLPYTLEPCRVPPTAPVRGLYAVAAPRAPYGPHAAAPREYVPVRGLYRAPTPAPPYGPYATAPREYAPVPGLYE